MRRFVRPLFWLAGAFVLATKFVEWTTEAWFFEETGYLAVFWRLMRMRGALFCSGATLSALLLWLNLRHAMRVASRYSLPAIQRLIPLHDKRLIDRFRPLWAGAALGFLVILSGSYAAVHDLVIWRALTFKNTGEYDAIFGHDVAFSLFSLPALNFVWTFLFILLWMNLLLVALFYAYEDVWQTRGRISSISPEGMRHLAFLGALLLLWKTAGYRLSAWNMITARGEPLGGFDFTALHFRLLLLIALAVFAFLAAVGLGRVSHFKPEATRGARQVLLFWGAANLILGTFVPICIETIYVTLRRDILEPALLEQRRAATRSAFALNNVRPAPWEADLNLVESSLPLWTPELLQRYLNRTQRRGEDFVVGLPHFDCYRIGGKERPVFVAPREGVGNSFGHGLIFCDATKISPDGQPLIYAAAQFPGLHANHPEIVFGNRLNAASEFLFAERSTIPDFWQRQPRSEEPGSYNLISASKYQSGLDIKPFWRRFLLAWRFWDSRLLGAHNQKIVWHRQIIERCKLIAPFFVYGEPRPILAKGRILWLIAAHSVADSYPLAFAAQNSKINYLRAGAVAVVDAYDGSIQFFVLDESDWLLQAHRRVFPEIFQDFAALPEEWRVHLGVSALQFAAQSDLWARVLAPTAPEIVRKEILYPVSLRQAVPWNNIQTVTHPPTPFLRAKALSWIQIFSADNQIRDKKFLSTPISTALWSESFNGQPQLFFWRARNPVPLPQMPRNGLFTLSSMPQNNKLVLRGLNFSHYNSLPTTFWFSEETGFQSDFMILQAELWKSVKGNSGTQVAKDR